MRVLVCGGRTFSNKQGVFDFLDTLHDVRPVKLLINGGAQGADMLAFMWAVENEIPTETYNADWSKHGKAAGPIRNSQMLSEGKPDALIAFPGGRGTADMVSKAGRAGVEILEFSNGTS